MNDLVGYLRATIERRDRVTNLLEGIANILSDADASESSLAVEERITALSHPQNGGTLHPQAPQVVHQSPWPVNGTYAQPQTQVPSYSLQDVMRKAEAPEMVAQRVQQGQQRQGR